MARKTCVSASTLADRGQAHSSWPELLHTTQKDVTDGVAKLLDPASQPPKQGPAIAASPRYAFLKR